ncbi:hypothetical protein [Flavobacterium suzhouense]|uniref:O-antigen/teichoic acid export membrane protein n=1 Tax=Flavobacterium suzhouense TaxID=1529638 RepID=A0ABW5NVD8_9FLAO
MYPFKKIAVSKPLLAFTDQALFSGTSFLLTLLLAQKMDIKSFGIYSSVVLIVYLLVSVFSAVLIQPFQVSFSTIKQPKQYISFLFSGLIILLSLLVVILLLLNRFIFQEGYHIVTGSLLCFCVGFLINDFLRKIFLGTGDIRIVLIMDSLYFLLLIYLFITPDFSLSGILWILGSANLISSLPGLGYMVKHYEIPVLWGEYFKDHIQQGKWLLSVAVLQWCSGNFFVLVSGIYLGVEALGALRLVQSFFGIINVGLQTIENYFVPKISSIYNESVEKAKAYIVKLTVSGLVIFGVILLPVFVFSDKIIFIVGGLQYQNYGYVVKMICILYLFIFLGYPVRISIRVLILNKTFFIGYLMSFISSIATFHFLLEFYGLYGAITGLIINQLIMMIYWQNQLNNKQFVLWK